jgi:hypothetical protein
MEAGRQALNDAATGTANAPGVERRRLQDAFAPDGLFLGDGSLVVEGGGAWTASERSRPATAPI